MNTDESDFLALVHDPHSWLSQAEQFYSAAQALVPNLNRQRPITEKTNAAAVGSLKAVLLLLAISVENALKSVKAMNGNIIVTGGKIDTKSFGGQGGHDLIHLANSINFSLSHNEKQLLEQLTEVVLWAGRYQQPLTAENFGRAKRKNPRQLTVPKDIELIGSILGRLRAVVFARA